MSPKLLNILLILVPTVLYFGYIDPLYSGNSGFLYSPEKNITALRNENIQVADNLIQANLVNDAITKMIKDYKSVDPAIMNKASLLLPDSIDDIRLRSEVLTIANKMGVGLTGLKVETITDSSMSADLVGYKVSFSITSQYETFKKMMTSFEKNMRFYIVDNVAIARQEKKKEDSSLLTDSEDAMALSILVSFRVFYLK